MRYILTMFLAFAGAVSLSAQEFGKKLGSVSLTIDEAHPRDFIYEDDDVTVRSTDQTISSITFEIRNNTDAAIDFLWSESYFVITEETHPFVDMGRATAAAFGITTTETNSVTPAAKIGSEAKTLAKATTKKSMLFDFKKVNDYFEENGELPNDRAVLVFLIDGEKVEKAIPIQVYTGKIKRAIRRK